MNTSCASYSSNHTVAGDLEEMYCDDPSKLLTKVKTIVKIYTARVKALEPSRHTTSPREYQQSQYMDLKSMSNKLQMYNDFLENVASQDNTLGEEFTNLVIQLDVLITECKRMVCDYRNMEGYQENPLGPNSTF